MPRIKMTDKGGFTTVGEGIEIDVSKKFTRSNEGCIQGWVHPVSGSVGNNEIIVGATGPGQSDSASSSARAPRYSPRSASTACPRPQPRGRPRRARAPDRRLPAALAADGPRALRVRRRCRPRPATLATQGHGAYRGTGKTSQGDGI